MVKVVCKIDAKGYVDKITTMKSSEVMNEGYIDTPLPGDNEPSLYRPRWDGEKWIEDMTQEEIDELNNQPKELTIEEQQQEIINTLGQELAQLKLQIMMGGV